MAEDQNTEILVPQDEAIVSVEAPKVEAAVDPDIEALRKQLTETQGKVEQEAAARRAAEERAQSAEAKSGQSVTSVVEARKAEAASLISAHRTAFDQAEQEFTQSLELGKYADAAKAQAKMNAAQINLDKIEIYKNQLQQFEAQQAEQAKRPKEPEVSARTQSWIDAHPEFNTDKVFQAECIAAHNVAIARGIRPDTDEYYRFVEQRVGLDQNDEDTDEAVHKAPRREPMTNSAPVSRATPQNNGRPRNDSRVQLTPADRDMAEMVNKDEIDSGKMTREDAWKKYAATKLRLQNEGLIGKAH